MGDSTIFLFYQEFFNPRHFSYRKDSLEVKIEDLFYDDVFSDWI